MYKIIGANQAEYGPITADQLRAWIAEGRVNGQTAAQAEGETTWRPLSSFSEFASSIPSTPPPVPMTGAPAVGGIPAAGGTVPNYLTQAILCTLCCCIPFGIVAIVYASQVNGKLQAGDYAGAAASSKSAKMWCWVAFGCGLVTIAISVILQVLGGALQGLNH